MSKSLDTLTLKGFKSFRSLEEFRFENLNVLIGGNGAGKSNLIQFFRMLGAMMKQDGLREFIAGSADAYLHGGPKTTAAIQVAMRFGENGYDFELAPTEDGFFLINNERRYHQLPDQPPPPCNLGSGNFNPGILSGRHDAALVSEPRGAWHAYEAITSWMVYHFHDTTATSGMRRYQDQGHNEKLAADGANIAPYLLRLRESHPFSYKQVLNAARVVIPFFDDFILKPNANEMLRLEWRHMGIADYPMRPSQLSDGSIRFICLSAALLQPNLPSMIIIDEPELGLHPNAVAILGEVIASVAEHTQVVVATQSPEILNYFAMEDIIVVNRKDGQSTFERLKTEDFSGWLEDHSVGELWTTNVIAGGPCYEPPR